MDIKLLRDSFENAIRKQYGDNKFTFSRTMVDDEDVYESSILEGLWWAWRESRQYTISQISTLTDYRIVPFSPSESQWGGIGRDLVKWMRTNERHSPKSLYVHFRRFKGIDKIPDWMMQEIENQGGIESVHVMPKGTCAALIYKAMISDSQALPLFDNRLHPKTASLVHLISLALAEKLLRAQEKYGYSDEWSSPDWKHQCFADFYNHIGKGDPIDVIAYAAFMWYHGWPTNLKFDPVDGDLLPSVGSTIFIELASSKTWEPHTVTGYYVWGDLGGDEYLNRVFVRCISKQGYSNARMLRDIKTSL